jgi:CheY-like chemotaxis protein
MNPTIIKEKEEIHPVDSFSLYFKNPNLEESFTKINLTLLRKKNLAVSMLGLVISLIILILFVILNVMKNNEIHSLNLVLEPVKNETLITLILNGNDTLKPEYLFYGKFLVINQTQLNLENSFKEDTLISTKNQQVLQIVRGIYFFKLAIILVSTLVCFHILCFLSSYFARKNICQNINLLFITLIFNQTFYTVSGMLLVIYRLSAEVIYILIAVHVLLKLIVTFKQTSNWRLFFIGSLLSCILEWMIYGVGMTLNNSILFYLIVHTFIHFISILIAYSNEKKIKYEFYLLRKLESERMYATDLMYNLAQGFISYNKEILFLNKSMKKIIINHGGSNDDFSLPHEENYSSETEFNRLSTERGGLKNKILQSNVKPNSKKIIDNFLSSMTDINPELPDDIMKCLSQTGENKFDKFYEMICKNENFSSFSPLGVITLSNGRSFKFQVLFRIKILDVGNSLLEIMFNDVSEIVENEREKAVINSRSIYLSKIAHEFKNPITSIMELSNQIKDDNKRSNKIYSCAHYIEKLCRVMMHFLKDYSLFTNLKFKCDKQECFLSNGIKCPDCYNISMCSKCKICKNCEEKSISSFNYEGIINDLNESFTELAKIEKEELSPLFNKVIMSENGNDGVARIYSNKELFTSAIYNILFHSYKTSIHKGEIKIQVTKKKSTEDNNLILTEFEISDNSLQIDKKFIDSLYSNDKFLFEKKTECNYYEDKYSDNFNKYFEIYVAFYMIKKLGSNLKIEANREGSVYRFEIVNNIKELETQLEISSPIKKRDNYLKVEFVNEKKNSCSSIVTIPFEVALNIKYDSLLNFPINSEMSDSNLGYKFKSKFYEDSFDNNSINSNIKQSKKPTLRIMLIDDEQLIRLTLRRHISNISKSENSKFPFQFEITEASNCFQAISILYDSFNTNIHFDIIIIDEYMPNMKGSTLIKLLKQLYRENNFYGMKIVSHTAFDTQDKVKFILESGADHILSKPVQIKELKEYIINNFISND